MLALVYIDQLPVIQVVNEEESPPRRIEYDQVMQIASVVRSEGFRSEGEMITNVLQDLCLLKLCFSLD